jgi:hypothetical protein
MLFSGAMSGGGSPGSPSQCSGLGGLVGGHNSDLNNSGILLFCVCCCYFYICWFKVNFGDLKRWYIVALVVAKLVLET